MRTQCGNSWSRIDGCLPEKRCGIILMRSSGVGRDSPWRADVATDLAKSLFFVVPALSPLRDHFHKYKRVGPFYRRCTIYD